jgi:hypothetical protein
MLALSALPDYEVARALLPQITDTHLDRADALRLIAENRGIVPIAVDPLGAGTIYWADFGEHTLREWQFTYSVKHLAESGAIKTAFSTDFDILEDDAIGHDGIHPSSFVFHISRCGSTLLAKALARLESNVVINQGGPLQRGFWARLTDDFRKPLEATPENLRAFRRLVLAMTRRRSDRHSAAFVKFVSWNTLYLDFIQKAFPDVPSLFLYRNPVEVIASVVQRPTPALLAKGSRQADLLTGISHDTDMTDTEYLARCCAEYFKAALAGVDDGLHVVNYTAISPQTFPALLSRGLSISPSEVELKVMQEQFKYHSKDDKDDKEFQADSREKSKSVSVTDKAMIRSLCGELVDRLDHCSGNLVR